MALLPDYCPSARNLTVGEFSVSRFTTLSGAVVRRQYGTRAYDYRLELEYGGQGGLRDSEAAMIYKAWQQGYGATEQVTVPSGTWGGSGTDISGEIPNYVQWYFTEEPPVLEWQLPGYSKVRLTLRGRTP